MTWIVERKQLRAKGSLGIISVLMSHSLDSSDELKWWIGIYYDFENNFIKSIPLGALGVNWLKKWKIIRIGNEDLKPISLKPSAEQTQVQNLWAKASWTCPAVSLQFIYPPALPLQCTNWSRLSQIFANYQSQFLFYKAASDRKRQTSWRASLCLWMTRVPKIHNITIINVNCHGVEKRMNRQLICTGAAAGKISGSCFLCQLVCLLLCISKKLCL